MNKNAPIVKILLVDDSEQTRECLGHFLMMEQWEVVPVADGLEAIERLRQEGPSFALVISDVEMPRLDGWGLLAWVREHDAALPVVLMSGGVPERFVRTARRLGARGALPKPFEFKKLGALLESMFDLAGQPRSGFYCSETSAAMAA